MHKLLVNTDVLIDFSKGKSEILKELFNLALQSKVILYITPVNIAEFLNDAFLLEREDKLSEAVAFLDNFKIQPVEKKSGILAGQYLRERKTEYVADAMIAACCVTGDLKLATRNKKHFKRVKDLQIVEKIDDLQLH